MQRSALERYTRLSEPVAFVLAAASLPLLLIENSHAWAYLAGWLIVGAFAVDLVVALLLVEGSRRRYLTQHWFDVAIVVLSVVPYFRPFRAIRAVRVLRTVRMLVVAHKAATHLTNMWRALRGKGLLVSCICLSAAAIVSVYVAERDSADGNIDSFSDVLWWSASTVTEAAAEDLRPTTTTARAAAVVLIVCGVSLFGLITANGSARFSQDTRQAAVDESTADRCPNCGHDLSAAEPTS